MSAQPLDHRVLFRLAWPILVTMLSYTMLSVVNSIYVGWLGTADLAAIGLATGLVYLWQSFGLGLLSGVRILVANRTGAGQPAASVAITWAGVAVGALGGLVVAAAIPLGPSALRAMGASHDVLPLAAGYFEWRTAATPAVFVFTALIGAFQGTGDTRTPMIANLIANAVNLVVDPVLIFGLGPIPALGIDGAGIGCALGIASGLAFLGWRARGWLGAPVRPDRTALRELWRIGAPAGVQYTLDVGSFVILSVLLSDAGDAHLAAHVIVVRIVMVSFLPCHAIAEATGVLVGQSLGGGLPDRARTALRLGASQAIGVMVALGIVFAAIPDRLTAVVHAAPDVTAIATPIIVLYATMQVLDGIAVVVFGALTGAGDTRYAMRSILFGALSLIHITEPPRMPVRSRLASGGGNGGGGG
ncbi:MAG: MATE family efflux transporter, partial [Myxococcota bacterium]